MFSEIIYNFVRVTDANSYFISMQDLMNVCYNLPSSTAALKK